MEIIDYPPPEKDQRTCITCGKVGVAEDFYRVSKTKGIYTSVCKLCATKECTKCNQVKSLNAFGIEEKRADGYSAACKECRTALADKDKRKAQGRQRYANNREHSAAYSLRQYHQNKEKINEDRFQRKLTAKCKLMDHFNWRCGRCLNSFIFHQVYDFHHQDPEAKESQFSDIYQDWEKVEAEIIGKCVMLCATCHRIVHQQLREEAETKEKPKRFADTLRGRAKQRKLIALFGDKCQDCGKSTGYDSAYDFHHRINDQKKFTIGSVFREASWEELLEEAKKCDLLCVNCHRIRHAMGSAIGLPAYHAIGGLPEEPRQLTLVELYKQLPSIADYPIIAQALGI